MPPCSSRAYQALQASLPRQPSHAPRCPLRPQRRLLRHRAHQVTIDLVTGRLGLVSDAFHLTFGCGMLTFSLFAMAASRTKPDNIYTYVYKRLEVLAAFTNAVASQPAVLVLCANILTANIYMVLCVDSCFCSSCCSPWLLSKEMGKAIFLLDGTLNF